MSWLDWIMEFSIKIDLHYATYILKFNENIERSWFDDNNDDDDDVILHITQKGWGFI